VTPHLASLGAVEVSRRAYHDMLDKAIGRSADFLRWPKTATITGAQALAALRGDEG
jgi:leucyl/phenylalanyl-tRNA--protein transferase